MAKGLKFGLMEENTKENITRIRGRGLGLWSGAMGNGMKGIG